MPQSPCAVYGRHIFIGESSPSQKIRHRIDFLRKRHRYVEMTEVKKNWDLLVKVLSNDDHFVQLVENSVWKAVELEKKWYYFNAETWDVQETNAFC
jgi:hypothetical protein